MPVNAAALRPPGGHGADSSPLRHSARAFPTFDGNPGILSEEAVKFDKSGYQIFKLTIHEHTGTHFDAPLHFSKDGAAVADLPVENLMAPPCVVDIAAKAAEDANAMVMKEVIDAWIAANGEIPVGACIGIHSGRAAKVGARADTLAETCDRVRAGPC